ncbi:MAG: hypothetical protein V1772_09405 [Chloroflexota bacterium]
MSKSEKLRHYVRIARLVGVLILLAVVGVVIYQLYVFYSDKVGYTADKAIATYFTALSQGNHEQVYQLTAQEELADIYGRPITKAEFFKQLRALTGEQRLAYTRIEARKLFEARGWRYYEVTLESQVGGSSGTSRILLEVRRVGGGWAIKYPFAIMLY